MRDSHVFLTSLSPPSSSSSSSSSSCSSLSSVSIFHLLLLMVLLLFQCIHVDSFYHSHHHHHHHHHNQVRYGRSMALRMKEKDKVSFGERLDLQLPSSSSIYDQSLLEEFIANPALIIGQVWEKDKIEKLGNEKYLLKFVTIPVLNITPEIEVYFVYNEKKNTVNMKSGDWRMLGAGDMKSNDDREFLNSFDISLGGELSIDRGAPVGWINYAVSAKKPQLFNSAPFLLDGTIDFIKVCVKDFVLRTFPREFRRAYEGFSLRASPMSTSNEIDLDVQKQSLDSQFEVYETLGLYTLPQTEKQDIVDELYRDIVENRGATPTQPSM